VVPSVLTSRSVPKTAVPSQVVLKIQAVPTLSRDAVLEAIDQEWPAAVKHADLPEDKLSLWKGEVTPKELRSVAAQHFGPHLNPDPPYAFSVEQYAEATSPAMREKHRIVMHLDYVFPDGLSSDAVKALIGALLRHELQHARQVERWGPDLFNIYDQFVYPAMGHFFGGSIPGSYVNNLPIELDANAAAAEYLREHHREHINGILKTDCANLARITQPPQPVGTLMARTIAFLYVYKQQVEELTGDIPVLTRLGIYDEGAADTWRRLTSDNILPCSTP
jgi:hypothetical protein